MSMSIDITYVAFLGQRIGLFTIRRINALGILLTGIITIGTVKRSFWNFTKVNGGIGMHDTKVGGFSWID